ncbi:hypothetical protein I5Q82_05490 [Acutalibacter muris]|uniref:Uncharacterized protein n=1 Tax=Acutalibacter muris TaxID=1796620 RepID=A0A1Z2XTT5_9FIRM|nr:hypothetical protein [Acutalibacter muris]ANU54905.1 hypothetical protein A4V00_13250 [Hungateiclostridiaceae bacterium KB18]ASB41867.1 hypothetical protein ADH66_15110 [Acutalibacter muris]QQR31134.1 hypothetical protein I5Q82_05490 [Acutalibacter muris]WAK78935.1 hypothetical protein [Acutalibacter phage Fontainebleau]
MDQKIINITFHQGMGHMTVMLDAFFPTDAARLRKLLSIIDEDYEHRDELRAVVVQHCGQRAQALMDGRSDLANQAINYHTKATELQPEIDKMARQVDTLQRYVKTYCKRGGQGYRQQLKELKAQLKEIKEQQRHALTLYRDYQRRFVGAEKEAEKLKKNVEVAKHER